MMDFETEDLDEDMRLAIHLSQIESQYLPPRESQPTSHLDEDYKYALKLSEALNSSSTSGSESTTFPVDNAQQNSGFLAAVENETDVSRFTFTANVVDEDYLLAVQLAEEDLKNSSCGAQKVEIEDGFSNDLADADYELALRLAAEESSSSSRHLSNEDSASSFKKARGDLSEPAFNSEISDHDLILSAQLFEMDDSNVEIVDGPTGDRSNRARKKSKSSPNKVNSSTYLDKSLSVVDPAWETIDPNPDIYALFGAFNERFFWSRLDMVEVKWSARMTLCAGICSYHKRAGHCVVKLSKPLLSYRPRKDLVETLLHEMIHAYLFVTNNDRDRDGHGPHFHQHMYRINKDSGAKITVYHSFHDEVRMYKTHVWKCDGPCQNRKPFYGLVKRSMNRVPGPNDLWWAEHSASCGGKFHKIKEPENYGKKGTKRATKSENQKKQDITKFLSNSTASSSNLPTVAGTSSSSSLSMSGFNRPNSSSTASNTNSSTQRSSSFTNSTAEKSTTKSPVPTFGSAKIVTLTDLSKNARKRSPTKSPTKSPKKWAPLPGQKNILSFIHKS